MGSINPVSNHHAMNGYVMRFPKSWNDIVFEDWQALIRLITGKARVVVEGGSLSIPSVVAVSRYVLHLNDIPHHMTKGL